MQAPIRYDVYSLTWREYAVLVAAAGIVLAGAGYLFYNSVWMALLFALLALRFPRMRAAALVAGRKAELVMQFRQSLFSLSSSLSAGRSVENAFTDAIPDLKLLYPERGAFIIAEFERIRGKLNNGEPIEAALRDFGGRSGVEDIANFADVFVICKRSGGNLVEVVRRSAHLIGEKIEIQQEIAVMVAQKRFESKALGLAPVGIVALLAISSPDYMAPLYGNAAGFAVMTACLLALLGCFATMRFIMNIKV
ncbi:type II secretion system F family protein [Paenibacillus cymbidii]|uniref:type II secretion system F family protein n=1 Tax=Paenibacillus cymbidii TaxID=1639034 RepID=UPI00108129E9|nr:type II secretion system F family protein [Paenibacillus cymbidii]